MFRLVVLRHGSEASEMMGIFDTEEAAYAFLSRWEDELEGFEAWVDAVTP